MPSTNGKKTVPLHKPKETIPPSLEAPRRPAVPGPSPAADKQAAEKQQQTNSKPGQATRKDVTDAT